MLHYTFSRLARSVAALPAPALRLFATREADVAARGPEPLLFTPGPLTTSMSVKEAMLTDFGSRDARFVGLVDSVQTQLLDIAHVSRDGGYECVLVQGSGTYAVEATLGCAVPRSGGKLLVVANGSYGTRMASMAAYYGIDHEVLLCSERSAVRVEDVLAALDGDKAFTHVAMVHHETTAGTLNPVHELGVALADRPHLDYIVDSMSAFGAYDVDMAASNISWLVSSSNKMIEGVPGFSYALVKRSALDASKGNSRSLVLDLQHQWEAMQANGQFRFTPPTHSLLAFNQALTEHAEEGGSAGRLARYQENFDVLKASMAELGFQTYVDDDAQSCIIATFLYADDPSFNFEALYTELSKKGFVLYPGKLTKADCFRVGCIGRMFPADIQACVDTMRDVLVDMGVSLPVTQVSE